MKQLELNFNKTNSIFKCSIVEDNKYEFEIINSSISSIGYCSIIWIKQIKKELKRYNEASKFEIFYDFFHDEFINNNIISIDHKDFIDDTKNFILECDLI